MTPRLSESKYCTMVSFPFNRAFKAESLEAAKGGEEKEKKKIHLSSQKLASSAVENLACRFRLMCW